VRAPPRDLFFYGHAVALAAGSVWLLAGLSPLIGLAPVAVVAGATAYVLVRELRTGRPLSLLTYPRPLFIADLIAAGLWMIATAPNPRSIAFVVVIFVGAMAIPRFGREALGPVFVTYAAGRIGQEWYRIETGVATPLPSLVAEAAVSIGVAVAFMTALSSYRRERERGAAALRRASSLERVARDLTAEIEPLAVFRSIPESALAVIPAEYAALVVRQGDRFEIASGAGLATRVVGMRRGTDEGVFSDVLRTRQTVALDDYREHPRAVPAARDLGIRSIMGTPITVRGELAACLVVGRTQIRPFDEGERQAIEGLAAHASIALANARTVDLARRIERLARMLSGETSSDRVFEHAAREASEAFHTEFVFITALEPGGTRLVAGVGAAAALVGRTYDRPGPLTQQVVERREAVFVRDYLATFPIRPEDEPVHVDSEGRSGSAGLLAREAAVRAVVAAPMVAGGAVAAVLVVGTPEPSRTFDELDRQGIARLAEAAAAALDTIRRREQAERRLRRLALLNEAATRLAVASTADGVAKAACDAAGELVERDAFYVARYDDERQVFHFILQWDAGLVEETEVSERWDDEMVVPLGEGPTSEVVRNGQPFVVHAGEGGQHAGRRFGDRARPSESAVHVPLRHGERIVGVLSAQSYRPNAYDDEDVTILQSLANLVAGAFEKLWQMERLRDLYLATVRALAAAVDARDPYTRSHSARVAALARVIAAEMELGADEVRRVQLGALLHDIGKIGIPDAILNKPGVLSQEEWVVMRTHPAVGASIIEAVEPLADLVPIVRDHHEHYDGKGYPSGLAGDAIDLPACIVAAADAYEVIVTKRSYKEAQTVEFAMDELRRCRGTQFHPGVVDAFLQVIERDIASGTRLLARVGAIQQEDFEDVAGPGEVLQEYVARSQTHGRRLAVLQRLASEFGAVLDIDELAGRLLRIVCDAMGYEEGFLTTLDRDAGELVVRAAFGPSTAYLGSHIPRGVGISAWVLEHGKLQNVGDAQADPRFFGPPGVRSSLVVPLRNDDDVVGVMGIESPRSNAFTVEDEQLLTAVSHQIAAAIRVANLHRAAKHAASTDPLTGLANRRAFFERLDAVLAAKTRGDRALTVALVDVDELKQLNDRYGHQAGDEGLTRVGEMLVEGVRSDDLVARIGGDEFAVLFVGEPIFVADRVMRRVSERISGQQLSIGVPVPTVSWGLAQAAGPATADQIIDVADRAMYRRKRRARTRTDVG